jgi:peptide/nickel transport system permease protein
VTVATEEVGLRRFEHRRAIERCRRNPLLFVGGLIGLALVLVALLSPLIVPYPSDGGSATHPFDSLLGPSLKHWFGTDVVGRDIFSRVLLGARVSLRMAGEVLIFALGVGGAIGILAGYAGGAVDAILMRVTDVFLAFPPLLLALAFASVLHPSINNAALAIGLSWWPWYCRLARAQAASVSARPFIESSRAVGLSPVRIVIRHVVPNSLTPLVVQLSLDIGGVILTAAALSFLGLGAQDPTPDWGLMVSQGEAYFTTQWWVVTFPGAAIVLAALAFNLMGDGVRDVLDPRRVVQR